MAQSVGRLKINNPLSPARHRCALPEFGIGSGCGNCENVIDDMVVELVRINRDNVRLDLRTVRESQVDDLADVRLKRSGIHGIAVAA